MNRRDFLKLAGLTCASNFFSSTFFEAVVLAQRFNAEMPNLVVFRIHGGMDCLQGLNPWIDAMPASSDLHTSYDPKDVLKNINGTQINLAPAARSLAPFANRMAIINGIWMGPADRGHPVAMQYITSGRDQEKAAHLVSLVSRTQKPNQFLIINGPIEKLNYEFKTLPTRMITKGLNTNSVAMNYLTYYKNRDPHVLSHLSLFSRTDTVDHFNKVLSAVRAGKEGFDEDTVVASFAAGLSSVAQIEINTLNSTIDNHFQYDDLHPKGVQNRWERISKFLGNLAQFGLLKKTLVVVVTEFSRTPALNANKGKDHNYSDNSVLLAGYGINGGTVVGGHQLFGVDNTRTEPQLSGDFIDFGDEKTPGTGDIYRSQGNVKDIVDLPKNVDLIRPANVLTTIAEILLPGAQKMFGLDTKIIPKIIKNT